MNDTKKSTADLLETSGDKKTDDIIDRAKASVLRAKQSSVDDIKFPPTDKKADKQTKEIEKALDKLYSADFFAPLMRAPGDIMLGITGDSIWNIPDKEITILSGSAATCARYFMDLHPKWVALVIFVSALTATYGSRTAIYLNKKHRGKNDTESQKTA